MQVKGLARIMIWLRLLLNLLSDVKLKKQRDAKILQIKEGKSKGIHI